MSGASVEAAAGLWALCRVGFEPELAEELGAAEVVQPGVLRAPGATGRRQWEALPAFPEGPCFARELLCGLKLLTGLPRGGRLEVLLDAILSLGARYSALASYAPDSEATKVLAPLAQGLKAALQRPLGGHGSLHPDAPQALHLLWLASDRVLLAEADRRRSAPWPGGVARLRFPRAAPSRSTLKLEEALHVLVYPTEQARWLKAGMRAVDLGAAPGGWTYQMVQRHIHVDAVDNGRVDPTLLDSGLVRHHRADGFHFRPKRPVDWLLCDMAARPLDVARLVARWLEQGDCWGAIVNLKLPMKRRYAVWSECRAILADAAGTLRAKQLYHDREEVTVLLRR